MLDIPEKGHNQGLEVSWRRAMAGDTGHPSKGPWASQRRVTAGTTGIQERLWLGTAGVLEKGHSWGPWGSWRRVMIRSMGIMERVGVRDCRHHGPEKDHGGDRQYLGEWK